MLSEFYRAVHEEIRPAVDHVRAKVLDFYEQNLRIYFREYISTYFDEIMVSLKNLIGE